MKKNEKIKLNYNRDELPRDVFDSLKSADEGDLRVMLSLILLDGAAVEPDEICRKLELTESEFEASLKYWCGTGLIKKTKKTASSTKEEKKKATEEIPVSAHRGGKLERKSELPSYSSTELAELIEKRHITAEFINEAQRVLGKIFNTHEVNILVGMVDYIGFDEASVIIILSHMVKMGKKSLRYAEQLAFSFYDEGITDIESLQAKLSKMEDYSRTESTVRNMFGMTGRSLTSKEKKFLHSWIETMGYDAECIRLAYDITVDKIHEPAPAYANSILEKWYSEGLVTYDAIVAAEEAKRADRKTVAAEDKSYDTDEFFEAALRRSFEEFNK